MMKRWKPRYLWFKIALSAGLLLSLVLLVQSVRTYCQVSRQMVSEQLTRDADRQILALERTLRQSTSAAPEQIQTAIRESLEDAAKKIAWIRVIHSSGEVIARAGEPTGPALAPGNPRPGAPGRERITEMRETPKGTVMVSLLPLRLSRPRPASLNGGTEARPPAPQTQGMRWIEIAMYLESASEVFSPLRRNLIIGCLAALGLAASMLLIWLRIPPYVMGKQLEEQVELARRVQSDLLPPANPAVGSIEFAAACISAWQVGGDFYDIFTTDQGRVALVLGDVAGKGLPAALLMGLLHGALRSMNLPDASSDQQVSWNRLNHLLNTRTAPERFASLFWSTYDPATRVLRYVNAGHLPPLMMRQNGDGHIAVHRLEEGGPILGAVASATYRQGEVIARPGDLLVLFSDGIVEAANSSEEEFGESRVLALIEENWTRSSSDIRDEILKQVRVFIRGDQPQDDITLVVARIR